MTKLLKKREIKLLINSKIIDDHPELQKFIKETPTWNKERLNELDRNIVLYFKNIHPKVMHEVVEEWAVDKDSVEYVEGNKIVCELCGHRPINEVCVIENKFNKKRLKIGNRCVTHFGISKGLDMKKLLQRSKRIKRLSKINLKYPGIEEKIDKWDLFIEKQDILIKEEIKREYLKLGEKAKKILEKYIDEKTTEIEQEELTKEIGKILEDEKKEIEKIENYVKENKDNFLIPSRKLINELKASNKDNVVKMLDEDGIIRHRTLFRIENMNLSKSLINLYNKELKNFDCNITGVTVFKNRVGYELIYKKKNKIKLFCPHHDLCFHYYNFITGDEGDDINFKELIEISEVYGENSIENVLWELFDLIKNSKFKLGESKFGSDIYFDYDEFYAYNKKNKCYYKFTLNEVINNFTLGLFIKDKLIGNKFSNYLEDKYRGIISEKDMDYIRKIRFRNLDKLSN